MKTKTRLIWIVTLLSLLGLSGSLVTAAPLGTTFTYQGRLNDGTNPANGGYDLKFTLFAAASGGSAVAGPVTNSPAGVTNGLFAATLDFGSGVFTGDARWLEIAVRATGGGAFTSLAPRQPLTPTPYALFAPAAGTAANSASVPATGLTGTVPDARLSTNVALLDRSATFADGVSAPSFFGGGLGLSNLNASRLAFGTVPDARLSNNVARLDADQTFTGRTAFNGGASGANPPFEVDSTNQVNNLNADLLDGLNKSAFWQTGGNGGHPTGVRFLGTTENEPLEIKVNNLRALRVEFAGDSDDPDSEPDGAPNLIGGSPGNFVGRDVVGATIAGGGATNYAYYGASSNSIRSSFGVIGGGHGNEIRADAPGATIGGGVLNSVSGPYATIPGGYANSATNGSFAAGTRAKAIHRNSFVWSDGTGGDCETVEDNSVLFHTRAGVSFSDGSGDANHCVGWSPGMASWYFSSDRHLKEDVAPVNSAEVLDKLARLPLSEWNYTGYPQRHIGPMAQDFHALFPLNDSDTTLNSADLDGVALAAIQGLNQKLDDRTQQSEVRSQKLAAENAALKKELAELGRRNQTLESRLAALEQAVESVSRRTIPNVR